jgi:hypothetical protein
MEKKCLYCGLGFEAKRASSQFCSNAHKVAYWRKQQKVQKKESCKKMVSSMPLMDERDILPSPLPLMQLSAPAIDLSNFTKLNMQVLYNYMLKNALVPDDVIEAVEFLIRHGVTVRAEYLNVDKKNEDFLKRINWQLPAKK